MCVKRQKLFVVAVALVVLFGFATSVLGAELWHYWLTGGEKQALDALLDAAREAYPESKFEDRGIPGATAEVRRQLGAAFMANDPPEAYQSAIGYDLKTYVDAGRLAPMDEVWEAIGGEKIFSDGLKSMVKFEGRPYAIPLNTHVVSQMFYNKGVFERLDLDIPTTWEEFNELAEVLRANGIEPLAASGGAWVVYQFYPCLLTVLGVDGYFELGRGNIPFTDAMIKEAFELYRDTMVAAYITGWAGYGWAEAANEMIAGNAAMYLNGDWVVSHFEQAGLKQGEDFGAFPAPGTTDVVIIQVDAIAAPANSSDFEGAMQLLEVAGNIEGQTAFNRYKGSVAANLNVPPTIYGPVLQGTYERIQEASERGAVLPNQLFMMPPALYEEFIRQIELFTLEPTDAVLNSVLNSLESMRLDILDMDGFVDW